MIVGALRMVKLLERRNMILICLHIWTPCGKRILYITRVLEVTLETANGLTSFPYVSTSNLVTSIRGLLHWTLNQIWHTAGKTMELVAIHAMPDYSTKWHSVALVSFNSPPDTSRETQKVENRIQRNSL